MSISITNPNKLDTPPIGVLDMTGTSLALAAGSWSRPNGGTGAAATVWATIIDDAVSAPARPSMTATLATVSNPTGSGGSWSAPGLMGAVDGEFKRLVVWLDIETEACYERDEVVFLGQAAGPMPVVPAAMRAPQRQPNAE